MIFEPDPSKYEVPCNCFGRLGQMESDMDFHEMGSAGCKYDLSRRRAYLAKDLPEEWITAIKNSQWGTPQMRQVYDMAIDECAAAVCGGCAQQIPIQFGRHQTLPGAGGGSFPCVATKIHALKI